MMLFLAVFLLVASAVILGQCVGELLARVNRYGTIALVASACVAWAARPWLMNRSATDVNPVIWKLLEALHGRWCLMWREGQAAPAAMYGTPNERLVYDQAYTFWPMIALFAGVMVFGNLVVLAVDPPPRGACPAAGSGMVVTTPDRKATRRCPWLW